MKIRILLSVFFLTAFPAVPRAEWVDFRVNHTLREAESANPVSDGKTIFIDGKVYDQLTTLQEIVVFNPERNRFYLLNIRKREKAIVTTDVIDTFFGEMRQWAADHENPDIRFLANPKFQVNFVEAERKYTFESKLLSYEMLALKPEKTETLQQYRQFADAYCKLNLMLSPGSKTTFARMTANDTVFKAGSLISRSKLTIRATQNSLFPKNVILISEYQFLPRLVESDRVWVRQVDEYIASFTEVPLTEYQKNLQPAGKK